MNDPTPIFINKERLSTLVNNNVNYCRYSDDIQMIYMNKKSYPTKRGWANHIELRSSWLNPIVSYLPLTIQYKNKYIPIICNHRNT